MAWNETCKIDFEKQVKHKKEQGVRVKDALRQLSNESGIPVETLKHWLYPIKRQVVNIADKKSVKNDTFSTNDINDLETSNKLDKQILKQAAAIKKKKREERAIEINNERLEFVEQTKNLPQSDKWNVYCDDIATWKAPRLYNNILSDPPYPKEYLYLYETLAERANEWLEEGGLLIVMCGQSYLDQIYKILSKHLNYYWTCSYLTQGQPTPLRQRNVNTTWKPILVFSKGKYKGKIFGDVFISEGNDKVFHKWGQSESGMYSIVSGICLSGQSILDPFCGAGTTGIAAIRHGCLFDGVDIEQKNVDITEARLKDNDKAKV